jgi:hypothetical protein
MSQETKAGLGATLLLIVLFGILGGVVVYAEANRLPPEPCGLLCECRHVPGERWLMCGEQGR